MAMDSNSAIGQASTANENLAAYYNDLFKYLSDTTGDVLPPDFQDVIDELDYSELLRMSTVRANDTASYANGAAIENIHQMVAIIREFQMCSKRKTDYYTDGAIDSNRESDYYANMKVFWASMLGGIYIEGATS